MILFFALKQIKMLIFELNVSFDVEYKNFILDRFYNFSNKISFDNRGGQSAARGLHAALHIFCAATVSNFGCSTQLFMTHLCKEKYPKLTSIMSFLKENKPKIICAA